MTKFLDDLGGELRRLSIKEKVYTIVTVFLFLIASLVAVSIYAVRQQSQYRDQLSVSSLAALNIERANGLIYAIVMESRGIYMSSEPMLVKRYGDQLLSRSRELAKIVKDWQAIVQDDDARIFAGFRSRIDDFLNFRAELVRRAEDISPAAGREWGDNEQNRSVRTALNKDMSALAHIYAERTALVAELGAHAQMITWLLVVLGIFEMALALLVALVIKRSVIQPIYEITLTTDRIVGGKTILRIPYASRQDEVGRLAHAVQHLQDTLGRNHELEELEYATSQERDSLEDMLQVKKAHLDIALKNMAQGLIMFDAKANVILVNNEYRKIYGLDAKVARPGCTFRDIMVKRTEAGLFVGDIEVYLQIVLVRIAKGEPTVHDNELADGRTIRVSERPMRGGGWVATHEDYTEQRRLQRSLERAERFLGTIIENVREAIVAKDALSLKYIFVNRAAETLFGIPRTKIVGKTPHEIFGKEAGDWINHNDRQMLLPGSKPLTAAQTIQTPGNGKRVVSVRRLPVAGQGSESRFLLSMIEDRTEASAKPAKQSAA